MSTELFSYIALLLGLASALLLVLTWRTSARVEYTIQNRLSVLLDVEGGAIDNGLAHRVERQLGRLGLKRLHAATGRGLRTLLNEAGIYRPEAQAVARGLYVVSPFVFALLAVVYITATGHFADQGVSALILGMLFGLFAPRYILRYIGDARRRSLRGETLMMIHLLKMLFEAGLSIEQALRTLRDQAGILLPHMHHELERVISRIEAGMERASVLDEWAKAVGVREVSDLAEMLSQLSRQGGNVQSSMEEMVMLMEDRNRTDLREKVGKLSGKMTVVMVMFLFPALMIFVAGPGFISIADALGGLQ